MANNYFELVADTTLPCTKELFKQLEAALEDEHEDLEYDHGMHAQHYEGQIHMFSEGSGDLDELPPAAMELIQEIMRQAEVTAWQFGYVYYSDKQRPGEFGGGQLRILTDGTVEGQSVVWESEKTEKERAASCAHADLQGILQCWNKGQEIELDPAAFALTMMELEAAFPCLTVNGRTHIMYQVDGHYLEKPNENVSVLMVSGEYVLPSRDDIKAGDEEETYYDEDVYFYGVTDRLMEAAIKTGEHLGEFVLKSYAIESVFQVKKQILES